MVLSRDRNPRRPFEDRAHERRAATTCADDEDRLRLARKCRWDGRPLVEWPLNDALSAHGYHAHSVAPGATASVSGNNLAPGCESGSAVRATRRGEAILLAPLTLLRRNEVRLFLTSFAILFVELLLIRWIPSNVKYIGFFSNFLLMASFLGIGLGHPPRPHGLQPAHLAVRRCCLPRSSCCRLQVPAQRPDQVRQRDLLRARREHAPRIRTSSSCRSWSRSSWR